MKKNRILLSLILTLVNFNFSFSQITGGGEIKVLPEQSENETTSPSNNLFIPKLFLGVSYTHAITKFATPTFDENDLDLGYGGMSSGVSLKFGRYFWFNQLNFGKNMKLGLQGTFLDLNFNFTHKNNSSISTDIYRSDTHTFFISSNVGPTFSYRIIDNLVLETHFNFLFTGCLYRNFVNAASLEYDWINSQYSTNYDIRDFSGSGFAVRYGWGISGALLSNFLSIRHQFW